ncbi:hypothetical protein [Actinoplanes sp. NPDC023714]|uniref:hypothetical protein n=1 Tax=Actinoplanes sp. NPDC023714 TaxID=3154322 RepID=UPI0033C40368
MTATTFPGWDVALRPAPGAPGPLRTDIAGFAGRAPRGPAGRALLVRDLAEFTRVYGAADGRANLCPAVAGYFRNGGDLAYVVRVLGPGARPSRAVLPWEGGPAVTATSPGTWADDLRLTVTRRVVSGGRISWSVEARPVRGPAELSRGTGLGEALAALTHVRVDPAGPAGTPVTAVLTGGADGDPPGIEDYRAALRPLLEQPEVAFLSLPDLWGDLGDAAVAFVAELAPQVHATVDRLVLLDLPAAANASTTAALTAIRALDRAVPAPGSRAVAIYHPWIVAGGPDEQPGTAPAAIPASGHVAGLASRLDREAGPLRTPANAPLVDVVDAAGDTVSRSALVDNRVNPIRALPGRGLQVWGGRTFDPAPQARFVAHRRLVHRLVRAARRAAEPLVFEPDGPELRLALTRAVTTVLLAAFRSGALLGRSPAEAFEVRTESGDGRAVCDVQFAPADPMEFIRIRLTLGAEGRLEVVER